MKPLVNQGLNGESDLLKNKAFHTDNKLEFCNQEFDNFYEESGILRHGTVRYSP